MAQSVKESACNVETWVQPLSREDPLEKKIAIHFSILPSIGFPDGSVVKNLPANAEAAGGTGSILGLGRSPGEGNENPV